MPNIPLMELIHGAAILFTMARAVMSASLAGQPRQRAKCAMCREASTLG